MGLKPAGFGGGRRDAWEADDATYWGPELWENGEMVTRDKRWRGQNGDADYDLENPLAAFCVLWSAEDARRLGFETVIPG